MQDLLIYRYIVLLYKKKNRGKIETQNKCISKYENMGPAGTLVSRSKASVLLKGLQSGVPAPLPHVASNKWMSCIVICSLPVAKDQYFTSHQPEAMDCI